MTAVPGEEPTQAGYPERWEERWQTGKTQWDQGKPHQALLHLLEPGARGDELGIPREGRAVVPGCGRGYDLPVFSHRGLDTVGLDISETGAAAARKFLEGVPVSGEGAGKMEIQVVDFFRFEGGEGYDVIYDYTFLCALPPDLRPDWGRQITALARKAPSTRFITLIWPLEGNPGGPPFSVDMPTYHSLLDAHWELIHLEDVPVGWKRHTGPPGGEKLGVWKLRM